MPTSGGTSIVSPIDLDKSHLIYLSPIVVSTTAISSKILCCLKLSWRHQLQTPTFAYPCYWQVTPLYLPAQLFHTFYSRRRDLLAQMVYKFECSTTLLNSPKQLTPKIGTHLTSIFAGWYFLLFLSKLFCTTRFKCRYLLNKIVCMVYSTCSFSSFLHSALIFL